MGVRRISHLGICVSDLQRSLAFYTEGLGFREVGRLALEGEQSSRLLELPGVRFEAVYLECAGVIIELLHYAEPEAQGDGSGRPMNARGLTHLSLAVDDLEALIERIPALGGRVLHHTRLHNPDDSSALFALDPDGTRLELLDGSFDPRRLP
jgi:catechol 2,3-dioxygenase-like lactoylglutathione lyase family enzyme